MRKETFIAFLTGAIAGGVTALLFAPQSGKETRKMIGDGVKEGREKLMDAIEDLKDEYQLKKEEVLYAIDEARNKYQDAKEEVSQEIKDAISCAKNEYEQVGKKLEKALAKK